MKTKASPTPAQQALKEYVNKLVRISKSYNKKSADLKVVLGPGGEIDENRSEFLAFSRIKDRLAGCIASGMEGDFEIAAVAQPVHSSAAGREHLIEAIIVTGLVGVPDQMTKPGDYSSLSSSSSVS